MLKYTVKRLAQSLVTILLIATIVFLLMRRNTLHWKPPV